MWMEFCNFLLTWDPQTEWKWSLVRAQVRIVCSAWPAAEGGAVGANVLDGSSLESRHEHHGRQQEGGTSQASSALRRPRDLTLS